MLRGREQYQDVSHTIALPFYRGDPTLSEGHGHDGRPDYFDSHDSGGPGVDALHGYL